MKPLETKFVKDSNSLFAFLEKDYGFVRRAVREDKTNKHGPTVSVLYEKPGVCVKLILGPLRASLVIGKVVDGKIPEDPNVWTPDTYSAVFTLDDLVDFRTQGNQDTAVRHIALTEENCAEVLDGYARALRAHGADVLKGDLSVLDDIATINRNRAQRFLP
ncbi:MAG: hypothetical protein E6Q43_02045 [Dokdonella sp.]|nr:MAG: hypothetical protein E6Q43_02045 [Dokdonella sp.]